MNDSNEHEADFDLEEDLKSLEAELANMSPQGISERTKQRIGSALSPNTTPPATPRSTGAIALIGIALSLFVILGWIAWRNSRDPIVEKDDPQHNIANTNPQDAVDSQNDGNWQGAVDSQIVWASVENDKLPNMWTYRKAIEMSFNDVDQLLATHGDNHMGGGNAFAFADLGSQ